MRSLKREGKAGFTLIELLIVIAIILILIAIALPNFLEAQVRAKVAHVRAELKTFATGLDWYHTDWRMYPIPGGAIIEFQYDAMLGLIPLSTPVPYIKTSNLEDPFRSAGNLLQGWTPEYAYHYVWANYKWTGNGGKSQGEKPWRTFGDRWRGVPNMDAACVWSMGPYSAMKTIHVVPEWSLAMWVVEKAYGRAHDQLYSPTNGTMSEGGIIRYVGENRGFPLGRS